MDNNDICSLKYLNIFPDNDIHKPWAFYCLKCPSHLVQLVWLLVASVFLSQ